MSETISTLIKERRSVRKYDPEVLIEKEEILEMLEQATLAPSTSNLQPWEFIVFLDAEQRKDLRKIAYNQEQIETASAVIAVLGDKEFYKNIDPVYDSMSDAGFVDDASKEVLVGNAHKAYPNATEESRKNLATFDSGLAAMQFMLIAKSVATQLDQWEALTKRSSQNALTYRTGISQSSSLQLVKKMHPRIQRRVLQLKTKLNSSKTMKKSWDSRK